MGDEEYVKFVNKTYNKTCSRRAVLPHLVSIHVDKPSNIVDFGAGKDAIGTLYLRNLGYTVTAYDIGKNFVEGLHDPDAFRGEKHYSVMMASNVINVQPDDMDIQETFLTALYYSDIFFFNYPSKPRKAGLSRKKIVETARKFFDYVEPLGISGSSAGKSWKCGMLCKPSLEAKS